MTVQVMMTMPDLPEGWEYTGEWRLPETGEYGLCEKGQLTTIYRQQGSYERPIVRPVYVPEPWIKDGWVYPYDHEWWWSNEEPRETVGSDFRPAWRMKSMSQAFCLTAFTNFTPPPQRRPYKVKRKAVTQ